MESEILINQILSSDKKFTIIATGGGTLCISDLLKNGGASSVFVGGIIPYDSQFLECILGYKPDKSVSKDVALDLVSYNIDYPEQVVQISCTASLRKNGQEREGRVHEAFIGVNCGRYSCYHVVFGEDRERLEEEKLLAYILLLTIHQYICLSKSHFSDDYVSKTYLGEKDTITCLKLNGVNLDNFSTSEESV